MFVVGEFGVWWESLVLVWIQVVVVLVVVVVRDERWARFVIQTQMRMT